RPSRNRTPNRGVPRSSTYHRAPDLTLTLRHRPRLPQFTDLHPAIPALPAVIRLFTDVVPGAHVFDFSAALRLTQDADDLLFTESASFHGVSASFWSRNYS